MWKPARTSSAGSRASPTPRPSASSSASRVHRRVRGGSEEDRRRRLPRPGHALSRRDRERQLHRRAVGDDQEPPQCRRPARADEHEAGRAACASCSRTRCASSAASSACPKRSSAAIRSPGPGLAIRIPGEVTKENCDILRKADAIYLEEIRNAGLYDAIWQAFAVLLPVRTVGVMGDYRTYDSVCALARGDQRRRHDRRHLPVRRCLPQPRRDADHQRGQGHQPGGLRLYVEAARHDRVGVSSTYRLLDRGTDDGRAGDGRRGRQPAFARNAAHAFGGRRHPHRQRLDRVARDPRGRRALADFNIISMRYRGLIEFAGAAGQPLMKPFLNVNGVKKPLGQSALELARLLASDGHDGSGRPAYADLLCRAA